MPEEPNYHYVITFSPALQPDDWFKLIDQFKTAMTELGYDISEFNRGFELDEQRDRAQTSLNTFEGFIGPRQGRLVDYPLHQQIHEFFARYQLQLQGLELD